MRHTLRRKSAFALALGLSPTVALAHAGNGHSMLLQGLSHPWSGVDHVLVMLAVGLWAAMLGGRARWALPVAFVLAMLGGAALSTVGVQMPRLDQAIFASLLVLGTCLVWKPRWSLSRVAALVVVCGVFHGLAHGLEMPAGSSSLAFFMGFSVSTGLLHLLGLFAGIRLFLLRQGDAVGVQAAAVASRI